MKVLAVKLHCAALENTINSRGRRVFTVAGSKTVHVESRFDLPQTIIDAIEKPGPEAATHQLALAPADMVAAGFELVAEVRLQGSAKTPRFVRRFDVEAVARPIFEGRQRCGGSCRLLFHLDLLFFQWAELLLEFFDALIHILRLNERRRQTNRRQAESRA